MAGHIRSHHEVDSGQVVPHRCGEAAQEEGQEDGAVIAVTGGEEGEHLVHEV